jgi:hypothetical protein
MKRNLIDGGNRTDAKALSKAEANLLDNTVEWAVLYDAITKTPISYYHHRRGIQNRLTVKEYKMCLSPTALYSLWIVPTASAREKGRKAYRVNGVKQEDIILHDDEDVLKIEIYSSGKLFSTLQKGIYI